MGGLYLFGGSGQPEDGRPGVIIAGMDRKIQAFHAGLLMLLAAATSSAQAFSRDRWIADFEQVKAALTAGYPNLEWAAQRGMDLPAHERRARERLAAANDDASARVALERFIAGFGDGHLELSWPTASPGAAASPPAPICTRLGFRSRADTSAIARGMPGYRELGAGGGVVAAGHFESGKQKVGVLRIAEFSADTALCERAIHQLNIGNVPSCDEQCQRNVERRADQLLVEFIEAAIRELVNAKVDLVLVDVAGNSGGNDSAIAAARMLAVAPLSTPRMQLLRGEARATDLLEEAKELRAIDASAAARKLLTPLIATLEKAAIEARQPCDLSPLWQGRPASCSNLLSAPFFAAGLIDEELSDEFRGQPWAEQVSATSRYRFTRAIWTGPVVILVDGNSASSTELFTAMLKDGGRARVIGAPTAGAGCGWTLPRQPVDLRHSGGRLFMPDCARVRRDGTNELDGIQPDQLIGFRRYDSAVQRVNRLQAALAE